MFCFFYSAVFWKSPRMSEILNGDKSSAPACSDQQEQPGSPSCLPLLMKWCCSHPDTVFRPNYPVSTSTVSGLGPWTRKNKPDGSCAASSSFLFVQMQQIRCISCWSHVQIISLSHTFQYITNNLLFIQVVISSPLFPVLPWSQVQSRHSGSAAHRLKKSFLASIKLKTIFSNWIVTDMLKLVNIL